MSRKAKFTFVVVAVVLVLVVLALAMGKTLPKNSVLVLELGGQIEEVRPGGALAQLTGPSVTLMHNVLEAIDHAKTDDRITGLVVKITSLDIGWAKIEEIRERIADFRQSKKPTICYLHGDMFGNREYFLATACEQVWLTPTAVVGTTGMMAQATFLRGTLDKLHVQPNMYGIGDYKTYRNQFTEKKFTPAHRESAESLLRSIFEQYIAQAAEARKLQPAEFQALLEQGPFLSQEAVEKKLVDKLKFWDEVQDHFRQESGDWQPVELSRYVKEIHNLGREKIAVVRASGAIVVGDSDYDPWEGYIMGSDSVAADLREAREDEDVKAIILRVDSGGGSAVASEIIRREIQRAREVKPVIVSMSDVAASGGYWIAMSANKIIAEPTTITGSIGVVFGKMNISGFYDLLGLSTDHVQTSENATYLWEQQNFTPEQEKNVLRFMQDTYTNFTQGVAVGRKMKVEDVDRVGQGRVWTGAQAKELGLVDETGGMQRALALARELAKIAPDASIKIERFPREKTLFQELFSSDDRSTVMSAALARRLRRLSRATEFVQVRLPFDLSIR